MNGAADRLNTLVSGLNSTLIDMSVAYMVEYRAIRRVYTVNYDSRMRFEKTNPICPKTL